MVFLLETMLGSGDSSYIIKLRGLPFSTTVEDVLDFLRGVNVCNGKEGKQTLEKNDKRIIFNIGVVSLIFEMVQNYCLDSNFVTALPF